jgi:hypothetical protein
LLNAELLLCLSCGLVKGIQLVGHHLHVTLPASRLLSLGGTVQTMADHPPKKRVSIPMPCIPYTPACVTLTLLLTNSPM